MMNHTVALFRPVGQKELDLSSLRRLKELCFYCGLRRNK